MSNQLLFSVKLFSVLGCGLVAGMFFAFSTFVMLALGQRPPSEGIAVMQAINITVINPWFMLAFLGTAATCLFLAASSLFQWQKPGSVYLLVGSLLYLLGTILVTMRFNVPMNDALAIVEPHNPDAIGLWSRYLTNWTFWNHVRTAAALAATASLTLALRAPQL
ncbi:anthrone oxygenase family protein [Acaryochloris marina]|uniref:DUF1772 domain-containing protein n=1 Tax=Acaryochloris marina (strain MBIC 11017) TaxID=329726 RepID=B0C3V3_ACAM1|nr:anthrone oxygenase family protein [Acaryochloris marina]ABW31040.1 conserved hypothetical protein [Acaryochloris marina MBIC11017]BDM79760.1 membrane protein [Acaryochloris marina MBIC10699]